MQKITLYPHQIEAIKNLEKILDKPQKAALDASDTGTGKTYTALGLAKKLGLKIAVIAPKATLPAWRIASENLQVDVVFLLNVEALKSKKCYFFGKSGKWNGIDENTLVVVDEVHRFSSPTTGNAKILKMIPRTTRVLMMSASPADSPLKMRAIGFRLGLFEWGKWWGWCKKNGCVDGLFGGLEYKGGDRILQRINSTIFPDFGVRVSKKSLGDVSGKIVPMLVPVKNAKIINAEYIALIKEREEFAKNALTTQLHTRQIIEHQKLPAIIELVTDALQQGESVAIFVNFTESVLQLQEHLKCKAIFGKNKPEEREKIIDNFQSGVSKCVVVAIQAGGVGISLHDTVGNIPRCAIIMPTFSAVDTIQCLGRVDRRGQKSVPRQIIVLADGTMESKIYEKVSRKIDCIETLIDSDLMP